MLNTSRLTSASFRLLRMMSHATSSESASVPWKEIRIPVPWGHIAAQNCGTDGKHPVLAIHGWLDNSGSFSKIAPLLPLSEINLIALDLPGHGFSSHRSPGQFYYFYDYVIDIQRVIRYLGWKTFSIIAHSFGSAVGVCYSATFPSEVQKFIALDLVRPQISPPNFGRNGTIIKEFFKFEEKASGSPPSVSKQEAVEMIVNSLNGSCSTESAEILLKRGATLLENGRLVFNRDLRAKVNDMPGFSVEQMRKMAGSVRFQYLLIKSSQSMVYAFDPPDQINEILDIYKSNAKSFEVIEIEGTHHEFLNNPEKIAPYITKFLLNE